MPEKLIGKRHPVPAGSERARDEERGEPTPRYGGGPWKAADKPAGKRLDADPSELAEAKPADDPSEGVADPEIESGGERAGMGRGDHPRKTKDREK